MDNGNNFRVGTLNCLNLLKISTYRLNKKYNYSENHKMYALSYHKYYDSKILIQIMYNRMEKKIEDTLYQRTNIMGTRETILALRRIKKNAKR